MNRTHDTETIEVSGYRLEREGSEVAMHGPGLPDEGERFALGEPGQLRESQLAAALQEPNDGVEVPDHAADGLVRRAAEAGWISADGGRATPVRDWAVRPGRETEFQGPGHKRWVPLGLELIRLVRDRETNKVIGADVRVSLTQDDEVVSRVVELPAAAASSARPGEIWQRRGIALAGRLASAAAEWLTHALTTLDAPSRYSVSHPAWIRDRGRWRLELPAECDRVADISEAEARERWREIVSTAMDRELDGLALMIGAARVSPLLDRLGRAGFTVNAESDSTVGKTTSARVAMATCGEPPADGQVPSWDRTRNELTKTLEEASVLPVMLDETNTATSEKFLADMIMDVSQGHPRGRLNQSGERREYRPWRLVVISTGERSILSVARVGASARALELSGPFMPDAQTADRLVALAEGAHGCPLRWLDPEEFPEPPSLDAQASRVAQRQAPLIALCAAGFEDLARAVGIDASQFARKLAERELVRQADALRERGETATERFWSALCHDVAANPGLYPKDGEYLRLSQGIRGVKRDGLLLAFKEEVERIASETQVSKRTVLGELHKEGRLVQRTRSRGLLERERIDGIQTDVYIFEGVERVNSKDEEVDSAPDAAESGLSSQVLRATEST